MKEFTPLIINRRILGHFNRRLVHFLVVSSLLVNWLLYLAPVVMLLWTDWIDLPDLWGCSNLFKRLPILCFIRASMKYILIVQLCCSMSLQFLISKLIILLRTLSIIIIECMSSYIMFNNIIIFVISKTWRTQWPWGLCCWFEFFQIFLAHFEIWR